MPAELQTRLLRVLQDGQFYRVGGHVPVSVNVRIIAATHQDLERKVSTGSFREDLFHRINVIRMRVPPLRERLADVPVLLEFFMQRAAHELDTPVKRLNAEVTGVLSALEWPGNVRQLENLCRWLTVMAPGREVVLDDLPPELGANNVANPTDPIATSAAGATGSWNEQLAHWAQRRLAQGSEKLLDEALPEFERVLIKAALGQTEGHKQEAARLLGWGRNTLTRKIKELGMQV